ncbi:MAG TPA: hypothetical protein VFB23_03640 [Candidatus Acidoferrales bacterium]|nr:hypothetical protein [Candidatus Acidoferrales bacterium]
MTTSRATGWLMSFRMVLGVLAAICIFTAAANAHPSFAGKFTLPFEVRWDHAVLPAGEYFIHMDSTTDPAVVTSASGSSTVFVRIPTVADSKGGATSLVITNQGNEHRVRSLNLPELRKSVVFAPPTRAERELLAAGSQTQAVPVIITRK